MAESDEQPLPTTWPIKLYLGALIFAIFALAFFTPALDGFIISRARGLSQSAICLVFALRLALAQYRHERNCIWIPYVIVMFLAMPLWELAENILFSLYY